MRICNRLGRLDVLGFVFAIVVATLGGCGGDGESDPSPAAPVVSAPVAAAGAAQTIRQGATLTFDGRASSDPAGRMLAFRWALTDKPAGSAAVLSNAGTAQPTLTADVPGTYVATLTVSNGAASSPPSSVAIVATAAAPLTIVASQAEPVSGSVLLSLSDALGTGSVVTFTIEAATTQSGGSSGVYSFNSATVADGPVVVRAHAQIATNVAIDVVRTLQVRQTPVTAEILTADRDGVALAATSPYGIASISASIDGVALGTLTAPNYCGIPTSCHFPERYYRFPVTPPLASGRHAALVVVTDLRGDIVRPLATFDVTNAPVVTVSSPADNAIVTGAFRLSGTATLDRPGVVTVVARLYGPALVGTTIGDPIVLQTTGPTFDTTVDLGRFPPGAYTLEVDGIDPANQQGVGGGTVLVASRTALAPTPVFSFGGTSRLIAVEGDLLLYGSGSDLHLRNIASGADLPLFNVPRFRFGKETQLSGGSLVLTAGAADCPAGSCVYRTDGTGSFVNISSAGPFGTTSQQVNPVARSPFVVWAADGNATDDRYVLYDTVARTYTEVARPVGVSQVGLTDGDLAVAGGVPMFVYSATNGAGSDVYSWSGATGVSTKRSAAGSTNVGPQTDGARIAWSQRPIGSTDTSATLLVADLQSGAPTAVSSSASGFSLRDGVLAWTELDATARVTSIKASTANGASVVSATTGTTFYGTAAGRVVYAELGKVYSWNAATGRSSLVLDTLPTSLRQDGPNVYFAFGSNGDVYKVMLP